MHHFKQGMMDGGVSYLLRDDFMTVVSAPLGSPLTAEPGPGSWTILDTGNKLSKSGGKFVVAGVTVSSTTVPDPTAQMSFARVAGRTFLIKVKDTADRMELGWFNTVASALNDVSVALQTLSSGFFAFDISGGGSQNMAAEALATDYELRFVLFATGGAIFIKGGIFTSWSLRWIVLEGTAATVYATLSCFGSSSYSADYAYVRDLPSPFTSAALLATVTDTTLALGDNWTVTADGIHEYAFTNGGALANEELAVLRYRWTDDNNCWKAYIKMNAGATAFDLLVDSVTGGVATNRLTVTGVGVPDLLRVIVFGTLHDFYTHSGSTYTKRGAQVNVSFQDTVTGLEISGLPATTRVRVSSYAHTNPTYTNELDRV